MNQKSKGICGRERAEEREREIEREGGGRERAAEMQNGYNGWRQALQIKSREEESRGERGFS